MINHQWKPKTRGPEYRDRYRVSAVKKTDARKRKTGKNMAEVTAADEERFAVENKIVPQRPDCDS